MKYPKLLILVIAVGTCAESLAQTNDDLYVYGFAQVMFMSRSTTFEVYDEIGVPFDISDTYHSNSFSLHQVNLFFQKPINDRTTFFLNFESSGSYSSKLPSGYIEIPEGWISYRFNEHFEVKAGLLLPKFNNLTEIQNRIPLFPYIIRPIVYESLIGTVLKIEDYRPEKAYLQLTYNKAISQSLIFDAAAYVGNAENSFLATSEQPDPSQQDEEEQTRVYLGENMNSHLLFGGRVGMENIFSTFKFGVSGTIDKDNKTKEEFSLYGLPQLSTPELGEIQRYRLGLDLSFTFWEKFSFETEYMGAFHDHRKVHKIQKFKNANLNKFYFYGLLNVATSPTTTVYGGYSVNKDYSYDFVVPNSPDAAGINGITYGASWNALTNTALKVQLYHGILGDTPNMDYTANFFLIGVSTIF